MTTIDNFNFSGKKAIIRVDFNVPLDKKTFEVTDDTRIKAALPTINKILNDGGAVILMSHLGRPKTGPEEKYSLKHIVAHTSQLIGREVKFVNDCIGDEVKRAAAELKSGEVLLLENLRFHPEEEKGDEQFSKDYEKIVESVDAKFNQMGDEWIKQLQETVEYELEYKNWKEATKYIDSLMKFIKESAKNDTGKGS